MPLIPRLNKAEKEAFTVRLNRGTAEELRKYCQFLESPQDYVIAQALEMVFRKDKEFARWSEGPGAPQGADPTDAAEMSTRGRAAKG